MLLKLRHCSLLSFVLIGPRVCSRADSFVQNERFYFKVLCYQPCNFVKNKKAMRKTILYLLMIVFISLSFSTTAQAQDIPEEEGEEIVIVPDENNIGNGNIRSITYVPFYVTMYQSFVVVDFLCYIGEVTIQLTNLSNNASVNTAIDSNCGSCIIPVTNGSGIYRIEFLLADGLQFYGFFIVF